MISGIVVAGRPEHAAELGDAIEAFPWAEVHYSDDVGRLVVTVTADCLQESIERLQTLQGLPRALSVSLAEYQMEGNEHDADAT